MRNRLKVMLGIAACCLVMGQVEAFKLKLGYDSSHSRYLVSTWGGVTQTSPWRAGPEFTEAFVNDRLVLRMLSDVCPTAYLSINTEGKLVVGEMDCVPFTYTTKVGGAQIRYILSREGIEFAFVRAD